MDNTRATQQRPLSIAFSAKAELSAEGAWAKGEASPCPRPPAGSGDQTHTPLRALLSSIPRVRRALRADAGSLGKHCFLLPHPAHPVGPAVFLFHSFSVSVFQHFSVCRCPCAGSRFQVSGSIPHPRFCFLLSVFCFHPNPSAQFPKFPLRFDKGEW